MTDLEFGLRTTVLGMGLVFGMLLLLWWLLALALRVERRAEGRSAAADSAAALGSERRSSAPLASEPVVRVTGAESLDPALLAAITVAVLRHAEARRLQAAPAMRSYWPGSLLFASRWVAAGRTRQSQGWQRRAR